MDVVLWCHHWSLQGTNWEDAKTKCGDLNENEKLDSSVDDAQKVQKMYLYRTLAGRRNDAPEHVWTL